MMQLMSQDALELGGRLGGGSKYMKMAGSVESSQTKLLETGLITG